MRLFHGSDIHELQLSYPVAGMWVLRYPPASWLRKAVDFILYGNIWIALCAVAQVMFTYLTFSPGNGPNAYTGLVMAATLLVYSAHSVVGTRGMSLREGVRQRRFGVILSLKNSILITGAMGAVGVIWFARYLEPLLLLMLVIPLVLSASYVMPFSSRASIRRLPYFKNIVVALSWSIVTNMIPMFETGLISAWSVAVVAERFFFLFALTILFDIRDMQHDLASQVRTLPHRFGIWRSKWLAVVSLGLAVVLVMLLTSVGVYRSAILPAYCISAAVALLLIWGSHESRDDYFYTGLIDGVMVLMPLLALVLT